MKIKARTLTASNEQSSVKLGLKSITMFTNDSETEKLYFSINKPISNVDSAFLLYPGEDASSYIEGCAINELYFKSESTSGLSFRVWGIPVYDNE